jgi:hypothetical protein
MMTGKRKKIYIAVIICCFLGTGGVLYFGLKAPPAPPSPVVIDHSSIPLGVGQDSGGAASQSATTSSGPNGLTTYPTPVVFPSDTKFDWSLLNSDDFKALKSIPDLVLDPATVGRSNPFGNK